MGRTSRKMAIGGFFVVVALSACAGEPASPFGTFETADGDDVLAVGEAGVIEDLVIHCGVEHFPWLINGEQWVTEEISNPVSTSWPVPVSWEDFVEGERVDVEVRLVDSDRLEVSPVGSNSALSYVTADEIVFCD